MHPVLERLYREREVVHRDGTRKPLFPTGLTMARGEYLFDLLRKRRPAFTLEIGCAYGISTLFIAEALRQNGHGHHLVIDPLERSRFDGLGLAHVEEAGLGALITFYDEPAELCLPRLVTEGVRLDFAFDDGLHLFDHVVTDVMYLARLLRTGALLVVDDANLPSVGRACDFVHTNRPDFEEVADGTKRGRLRAFLSGEVPPAPPHFRVFRKCAERDERSWDHFSPF